MILTTRWSRISCPLRELPRPPPRSPVCAKPPSTPSTASPRRWKSGSTSRFWMAKKKRGAHAHARGTGAHRPPRHPGAHAPGTSLRSPTRNSPPPASTKCSLSAARRACRCGTANSCAITTDLKPEHLAEPGRSSRPRRDDPGGHPRRRGARHGAARHHAALARHRDIRRADERHHIRATPPSQSKAGENIYKRHARPARDAHPCAPGQSAEWRATTGRSRKIQNSHSNPRQEPGRV